MPGPEALLGRRPSRRSALKLLKNAKRAGGWPLCISLTGTMAYFRDRATPAKPHLSSPVIKTMRAFFFDGLSANKCRNRVGLTVLASIFAARAMPEGVQAGD